MVYYRKYRPQTINQLDSNKVRDSLTAVLSVKEPAHAFLFTGPKGLGKTSTARIVAKIVNCEQNKFAGIGKDIEPCNTCEQCISITSGTNVDIVEIDGASNRNIDDVRDLKDKIRLAPASARKKVYIIDEVHMFTTDSFNALLKTLEEPPAHAMLILCTTEKHKVPATIVSRCFIIEFQLATKEELARSFKRIAEGEGLNIDDDAIDMIAGLAEGGFRDAQKILEELSAVAGDTTITKEVVDKRYNISNIKRDVLTLVNYLLKKETQKGLALVNKLAQEGVDIKHFLFQLLETLHSLLLQKAGVQVNSQVTLDHSGRETVYETATVEDLRKLLILCSNAYGEMKYAVVQQLPLELAIIDATSTEEQATIAVEEKVTVTNVSSGVTVSSMRKQIGDLAKVRALYGEQKPVKSKIDETQSGNVPKVNLMNISNSEITPEWLQSFWLAIIAEMKQYNHTIAGVLRGCMIRSYDKKQMIIETAYAFHKERLSEAKTKQALETVCKTLTGNIVSVEVVLKQ